MFNFVKNVVDFFRILFTPSRKDNEPRKPIIIVCPRLDEEVLVKASLDKEEKLLVSFSRIKKEMTGKSRYILSEKETKTCDKLVQVGEGCISTISPNAKVEDKKYFMLVLFEHLCLEFMSVSILDGDTVEIQPIDVDFTQYPAAKIGFFATHALGDMVTKYQGSYHIIMNEEKTRMRVCFQKRPVEGYDTFALGDKMLILKKKNGADNLIEIIIGGITEATDQE